MITREKRTVFVTHLLARRRDRLDLLPGELDSFNRIRGRCNAAAAHDLDEVRTALQLFPSGFQDLRHAIGCAAKGL